MLYRSFAAVGGVLISSQVAIGGTGKLVFMFGCQPDVPLNIRLSRRPSELNDDGAGAFLFPNVTSNQDR